MSHDRGGFWPLRDLPVVVWLLGVVVVALAHPLIAAPRWLLIHLVLLGAGSHSILVWSRHFADALLHTPPRPGDRRVQSVRLGLLNAGVALVLVGVSTVVWPVTVAGASAVAVAVLWHGADLARQVRRALPGRFRSTVRYYVAAACFLPVGATLGTLLARGSGDDDRLTMAHAVINVFGWIGLPVLGTLVTLWPTMLRTRIADDAERTASRALPVLVAAIVVAAGGALSGVRAIAVLGLAGYLIGLAMVGVVLVGTARTKPPAAFPTWSVAAGLVWLGGCLLATTVMVATAGSWSDAADRFRWLTPFLAAGFAAQVLFGALSYLVPVALGGGAVPVRAANAVFDRGSPLRIAVVNAGLFVCVLPVPSFVRVACSGLVLIAFAAFLPLMFGAIRAARRARTEEEPATAPPAGPVSPSGRRGRPAGQVSGLAAAGIAAVVLAVALGVVADPSALAGVRATDAVPAGVAPTGHTTTVRVTAKDMRFTPGTIGVPVGDRLVIQLTNRDDMVHDLVMASGPDSGRLGPGRSARVDVGVVGHDIEGWCSVVGHRQMGMVLHVHAVGGTAVGAASTASATGPTAARNLDFSAQPPVGFTAHDAALPPLTDEPVHRLTITVSEVEREIAPGVRQRLWLYNGSAPGPVLHGRVGDTFEVTLVNDGSMGHSIDFHAGSLAPDGPMRTIAPGQSLVYRFTATKAGIWLYHCSSMPMSAHIASGMFGAVLIEPPGLPAVDRSYVLVQSEFYLGPQGGTVDVDKLGAARPDAVVFNGYADQYDARPLPARAGERVRIWVLDAGPNRGTSFHVVGGQFDAVYKEGAYVLPPGSPGGSQTVDLAPAQGGFVELTFPEAGHYPFISHVMVDAERGAHGLFDVTAGP